MHVCIFMTDLPQQISEGVIIRIYSLSSLPVFFCFFQRLKNVLITHMFKRRINVSQGEWEKLGEAETTRREKCADSACVWKRARGQERKRKAAEKVEWAQNETAKIGTDWYSNYIEKKTILQLGIYLHTLQPRWLSNQCFSEVGSAMSHK